MVARIMANGATPPRLDFVGGAGMAGFVEEWLFRGLVWNAIDSNAEYPRLGLVANLIAGSLVFGLFHLSFEGHSGQAIANVAPHAAFGLVMGILRWRTGSIVPGAVVHTVGNFVARLAMP
jgi:membrane protease YdiL (CAAX protease family)